MVLVRFGGLGLVDLLQQPLDAVLRFDRLVELELERRDAPEPQALADLVPEERRRPVERLVGGAALGLVPSVV